MKFNSRFLIRADKLSQQHSTEFRDLPIVIEWPKGSVRVGEDKDGKRWKREMHADYGYVDDTTAKGDHEELDVYIGEDKESDHVYIVEQLDDNGEFDEYKVMLGFDSLEDAKDMYLKHYPVDWEDTHLGEIAEVPFDYLFDKVEKHQAKTATVSNVKLFHGTSDYNWSERSKWGYYFYLTSHSGVAEYAADSAVEFNKETDGVESKPLVLTTDLNTVLRLQKQHNWQLLPDEDYGDETWQESLNNHGSFAIKGDVEPLKNVMSPTGAKTAAFEYTPMPEFLYHGTSQTAYDQIMASGGVMKAPSWWGTEEIAEYYAEVVAEEIGEDEEYKIIAVPLSTFNQTQLVPDQNSVEEPLTYTLGRDEDKLFEEWEASDQTWQDSLEIYGSVRYNASININHAKTAKIVDGKRVDGWTGAETGLRSQPDYMEPGSHCREMNEANEKSASIGNIYQEGLRLAGKDDDELRDQNAPPCPYCGCTVVNGPSSRMRRTLKGKTVFDDLWYCTNCKQTFLTPAENDDEGKTAAAAEATDITETPAFKAWFAGSKCVRNGKPMRMYHGTFCDFDDFDPNHHGYSTDSGYHGIGFYFSEYPHAADQYAAISTQAEQEYNGKGAEFVMPVYLSIKNPYEGDADSIDFDDRERVEEWTEELKAQGYDGVHSGDEWVAFYPSQIKSAIGNSGNFNPDNPSITASKKSAAAPQDARTKIYYHGSNSKFDSFATFKYQGTSEEAVEHPVWLSPDKDFARLHAGLHGWLYTVEANVRNTFDGEGIFNYHERYYLDPQTYLPLGNQLYDDLCEGKLWADGAEHPESYLTAIASLQWDTMQSPEMMRWLKEHGYDSFYEMGEGHRNLAVFNPHLLKIVSVETVGNPDLANNEPKGQRIQGSTTAASAPAQTLPDVTQTPAFKSWFSGSEVVDNQGRPLVMYHATQSDIGEFRAYTHFGTMGAANDRHQNLWEFYNDTIKNPARAKGSNIIPVYLSVKNPLRMPDLASIDDFTGRPMSDFKDEEPREWNEDLDSEKDHYPRGWEGEEAIPMTLYEMGIMDIDDLEEHRSNEKALKFLEDKGYDGIVYKNVVEDPGNDSWIVFRPNQVKSAIGNSGSFDPASAQITASVSQKCPHCGSDDYGLMPSDFETAKCNSCGKNWEHGIVKGVNDPKTAAWHFKDDEKPISGYGAGSRDASNEPEPHEYQGYEGGSACYVCGQRRDAKVHGGEGEERPATYGYGVEFDDKGGWAIRITRHTPTEQGLGSLGETLAWFHKPKTWPEMKVREWAEKQVQKYEKAAKKQASAWDVFSSVQKKFATTTEARLKDRLKVTE